VAEVIAADRYLCLLHHYLTNETPTSFDPLPEFCEAWYLDRYPDVAAAVENKDCRNGYAHFLQNGIAEQRAPCPAIDLRYYRTAHSSVRGDLDSGRARDAFAHYLRIGRAQGLAATLPQEDRVTERQAALLNAARADNLLSSYGHTVLDFAGAGEPEISVVLVAREGLALTLLTLASLRANHAGEIELIVIDAGLTDEARALGRFVRGASLLRFKPASDFVTCANGALNYVSGQAVLFMDSAAELGPGTLAAALHRLHSDPRIGAVGGRLVRAHGRLQAAGGIVWRDGTTLDYLRDASPLAPEANFVRDVDFCSAAFLLPRTDLLRRLDGFDEAFAGGGAEVDLCLRIAAAGSRVVYDPAIVITRLTRTDAPPSAARETLSQRHAGRLPSRREPDRLGQVFARMANTARRVLFIDDMLPLRRLGSGFVRSNDLVRVMASLGYAVTGYPMKPCNAGVAGVYADMPDTAEVMHDRSAADLANFLSARRGYYDTIWIARTHNLERVAPLLDRAKPRRVVLDTEAIATLREADRAALTGAPRFDIAAAMRREFANAHLCASIVAVSDREARVLRDLGLSDVVVIGHWREPQPTQRGFAERAGMLFLGAMHQPDCPNRDALGWFVREVLPLVEDALGWETRLTIAGHVDPSVSLQAYRAHPRISLRGAVDEVEPLYDAHRLFIAPTRFASGLPYKVHEAASYGLPVVASTLLARQLDWRDRQELIAVDTAEPAEFACRIVALYRDPVLWQALRDNALKRVRTEHGLAQYEEAVRQVVEA
jgi:GT2 family glycosyltransferase/glycosyltransferase involved in cell wall biosynthesis